MSDIISTTFPSAYGEIKVTAKLDEEAQRILVTSAIETPLCFQRTIFRAFYWNHSLSGFFIGTAAIPGFLGADKLLEKNANDFFFGNECSELRQKYKDWYYKKFYKDEIAKTRKDISTFKSELKSLPQKIVDAKVKLKNLMQEAKDYGQV